MFPGRFPGRIAAARAQMNAHSGQRPSVTASIGICDPHVVEKNILTIVELGINEQKIKNKPG